MEQTGRLTLPTDADVVEETLRLKALLGADALRDCDGTEMPDALLQDPAKKYATYYTTRKDNASPVVDGEVKIADNAALKEALTVYKDMVDKGILAEYTDWDQYIASMNDGKAAGVINGCWIMSSVQAAADQSGKWAIVNMPKLDGIDGATNYANCGGASWAVSSNCKNTELAFDFLKSTFGSSVELYDDLLPNAGAISSYLPAAESDVYNQPSEFYGGQTVYKDIVEFAGQVPAFDCGAYYSDVRSALTDAVTNVVQNNADIDSEMQNAQDTVEFNIAG